MESWWGNNTLFFSCLVDCLIVNSQRMCVWMDVYTVYREKHTDHVVLLFQQRLFTCSAVAIYTLSNIWPMKCNLFLLGLTCSDHAHYKHELLLLYNLSLKINVIPSLDTAGLSSSAPSFPANGKGLWKLQSNICKASCCLPYLKENIIQRLYLSNTMGFLVCCYCQY